jgi:hypothetical protein
MEQKTHVSVYCTNFDTKQQQQQQQQQQLEQYARSS